MIKNSHFSNTLKIWYLENKRDLPWRKTKNPYLIWLSEIILQQTRIAQGMLYYLKFAEKYPNINLLAKAKEDEVLKLWQGLGYYSRARNLHKTAIHITDNLQGKFPNCYNELIKLKGVGDYTASAISSICFNEFSATVDGNVYRFLSRYFGISTPINSSKGQKEFKELAQLLISNQNPGDHNQAMMEFGALVCKPKKPDCYVCSFENSCYAMQKNKIEMLPVKENKIKIKKRYFNYLIINSKNEKTFIQKRIGNDIWRNLYEFILHESNAEVSIKEIVNNQVLQKLLPNNSYQISKYNEKPIIHKLTHQHLFTTFWIIDTNENVNQSISWEKTANFALPTLIQNFVDKYKKRD
ncbi:MAG: A/G-specific adenine glycosylase [Flavobacteriaceae bacterium]|nr:A/G-specific adenine glycosylase [Flavobacteriaceae bacterium]